MPQPCVSDAAPAASWWLPSLFDANKIKSMPGNHVLCWLPTFAFMQLNLTRERAPVCSSKAEGICPRICNLQAKQNSGLYVFKSGDAPKNTKQIANLSVKRVKSGLILQPSILEMHRSAAKDCSARSRPSLHSHTAVPQRHVKLSLCSADSALHFFGGGNPECDKMPSTKKVPGPSMARL